MIVFWVNFNLFPLFETSYKDFKRINNLVTTVSLSFITSFMFYFIVVFLKEQKDRKNSEKFITRKVTEIMNRTNRIRDTFEAMDDKKFTDFIPDEDTLRAKFNKVSLEDDANLNRLYPFTNKQLIKEHSIEVKEIIDRILILLPFLDSKLT